MMTYHFEVVQLLLDLLGKHWGQAVTSRDFAPAIVLPAWPGVVKYDTGTKGSVTLGRVLWGSWSALGVLTKSEGGHEVVLVTNGDRAGSTVAMGVLVRRTRSTRIRGVRDLRDVR